MSRLLPVSPSNRILVLLIGLPLVGFALSYSVGALSSGLPSRAEVEFTDVQKQARQFIEWERDIELTAAQEAIKKQALGNIPAPCCSDNSAYTCCCPCNLSRTVWGLANYLIREEGMNADQVRARAQEWFETVNPNGFSGDACYTGGCGKPFDQGGCGGMNAAQLIF